MSEQVLIKCGFCKSAGSLTHNQLKFPAGLIADMFNCAKCGAILGVSRAGIQNQPTIVAPSSGEVKKLGLN